MIHKLTSKLPLVRVGLSKLGSESMDFKRASSFSNFSSSCEKKIPKFAMWMQMRTKVITSIMLLITIWQFPEFPEDKKVSSGPSFGQYLKKISRGRQFLLQDSTRQTSRGIRFQGIRYRGIRCLR